MTTEQTEQPTTEPTPTESTPAEDKPKMMPVSAHQAQIQQAKEEAYNQAKAEAAAEAEKAKLAEQGKWEEWAKVKVSEAKAETEAERKSRMDAEATARRSTLKAELVGINNEYTLKGAIADCPADADPTEWAAKFRADNPALFTAPGMQAADSPPQGGRAAGGSQSDGWGQVQKDYDSGIPDKVSAATIKVLKYQAEHDGKKPPGNW